MSGSPRHEPVLVDEVLNLLGIEPGMSVLDGTVGMAGHTLAILERMGGRGRVVAVDLDPGALAVAAERTAPYAAQVTLRRDSFGNLATIAAECAPEGFDAILLDLGLSTDQLTSERFSFQAESRLDGRLDPEGETTAADLLATLDEAELVRILTEYGDEPHARRIARGIVEARRGQRLETAGQLTEIIRRAYPARARHGRTHLATRSLQALRIAVNDLYGALSRALEAGPPALRRGGRMGIIAFHSGEDRQVKHTWRAWAARGGYRLVTPKPVFAGDDEVRRNPHARSARLRVLAAEES